MRRLFIPVITSQAKATGDDEQIEIDLVKLPQDVNKILVVVNIYDCVNRKQDFRYDPVGVYPYS